MGWVLLLIMTALAIVTFVTWRVLITAVDHRMDAALSVEVEEFKEFTETSVNPATGEPFTSVEEMIHNAIIHQVNRHNEYFLGYVDGAFYQGCLCPDPSESARRQGNANAVLVGDHAFTDQVASITRQQAGTYEQPQLGEIRYLALPVTLAGDPSKGVIVAAFLADAERSGANKASRAMLLVGGVTMLLATAAAWLVAGRILRPLHDVVETAQAITDSDLSRRIPSRAAPPGDDIDRLVATINGMLDRIESGVAAQRRFIDDAAHEMRTPITIVRGHLDVLDTTDPADVVETVALVDDELDRMNRMVSDLLLLARAEQPSFLRAKAVDVGPLTRDVFAKVSQLGNREFTLERVADVVSVLDPQRITQALVALTDNACRYTADRDTIAIGSGADGAWLRFWVSDSGPGVSDEDRTRIFERFSRGSAGGNRSDGAGLGLSIVAAIAKAHGGRLRLEDSPAGGAKFIVEILAVPPPAEGEDSWPASSSPKTRRGLRRSSTKGCPPTDSASRW